MPSLQFKGVKTEKQGKKGKGHQDRLAILELFRLENCALAAFAVMAGFKLVAPLDWRAPTAGIAGALLTAGGNVINDFFDRRRDAINKPWRPVPSGRISLELLVGSSAALFGLGMALGLLVNPYFLYLAFLFAVLLVIYSGLIKEIKIFGNVLVSVIVGCAFFVGATAAGNPLKGVELSILAAIINWSREILKDLEEKNAERWTLSALIGTKGAVIFAYLLMALSVYNAIQFSRRLPPFNSLFLYMAGAAWCYGIYKYKNPTIGQRVIKIGMALIILSLLLL